MAEILWVKIMKTLIELYDERAIENTIGPETFKPERVVYMCPGEIVADGFSRKNLENFFASRGLHVKVEFVECSMFKSDHIFKQLLSIYDRYEDVALDVTGGTDAALVAAGMFVNATGVPTFTYSRKRERFYDIHSASFAEEVTCDIQYSVSDFFTMAGGTLRQGRVDNSLLSKYMGKYDAFFKIYMRHRREWTDFITFMIRISQPSSNQAVTLKVSGKYEQKGERGSRVSANEPILRELAALGFLRRLRIVTGESVTFIFVDEQIRNWLRDVGSVLELYTYKACLDTGAFSDVYSSAIVDWNGLQGHDTVSNEIDVVASRGVIPLFISCKACDIKTEALNELAILRDRFGGKGAKAAIVTTENCTSAARHRAAQLSIAVIDREELERGDIVSRIRTIMKA